MNVNNKVKMLISGMTLIMLSGVILITNASPNEVNSSQPIKNEVKSFEYSSSNVQIKSKDNKVSVIELKGEYSSKEKSKNYIENILSDSIYDKVDNAQMKHFAMLDKEDNANLPLKQKALSIKAEDAYNLAEKSYSKEDDKIVLPKPEQPETLKPTFSDKNKIIKAYPHNSFKSYMSWTALASNTPQGKLSAKATKDPATAIMKYEDRYLVALGFAYTDKIGEHIDIVMESGQVIPAIVGDWKAKKDTDKYNSACQSNGSIVEFIVSSNKEANIVTNKSGSYNSIFPGKVKEFRKSI